MTATFFLAGKLLGETRFDRLPSAAARLGALGDHTWEHVPTVGLPRVELEGQVARTRRAIAAETGVRVALLTVLWGVDTGDSQGASADRIFRTVRDSLSGGGIALRTGTCPA